MSNDTDARELCKTEEVDGVAFRVERKENTFYIFGDDPQGHEVCHGRAGLVQAHLNGAVVNAMALGAVATEPSRRRGGLARHCFRLLNSIMEENRVAVSYLHPFSFAYYRTMGYERVADHRELEFPLDRLSFLPRNTDMIRCTSKDDPAPVIEAYHRFCQGRNILFRREGAVNTLEPKVLGRYMSGGIYELDCKNNHIFYGVDEDGCPDSYLITRRDMRSEDHFLFGRIIVEEMGFTSPQALRKVLGFLRVYEGEVDTVLIRNCAMSPEVERVLRHYKYTKIRVVPDLSARIHNVEQVLSVMTYPEEAGQFTVKVTDCPKSPFDPTKTNGVWHVAYGQGKGTVTRLAEDAPWDIHTTMPAFTQLFHGYESVDPGLAAYMEGVEMRNDCADFFRAFPYRPNGLFELF